MKARIEDPQERAITKIATHLPDLIVYGDFSAKRPSVKYFDGVLMFVDISGFTAMTEKFSRAMYMDRGAEQLVEILNHYLSAIVEKVLIFGGDILKFAGDALLALWKVERKQMKNIITVVIKCSLEIHELFETSEPTEGLDIRVKIGLSAGHVSVLFFGDETHNYFMVTGQAVNDVRFAQNMAQMNEIILSPNCWQLSDQNLIEIERIPDQRAVKVNFLKLPPTFNFDEFFTNCMNFMDHYPASHQKNLLRLAYTLEPNPELELSLKKYVMESILKQMDDKQLRGYFSELRPVTIVFVNLMFKDKDKPEYIGQAMQDACVHITSVLRVFQGQINKIFMFDKGCSFLCVFGLPGEKLPDEATHALESAMDIFDFCSQMHRIQDVSIGVTSGTVFCGIVGHSVRHEYTVIGQKVNIAARMMMYYPGMVTCDSVTYNNSSLPTCFFKNLPKKDMKGVADSGPVYQCLGLNEKIMFGMVHHICNKNESYHLLGRDKEIKYFMCTLKEYLMFKCSRVLIYKGLPGYGKSQILMEIDDLAQNENHRTITIALTKASYRHKFYTIQILMAYVLDLDTCKDYKVRQSYLQKKISTLMDEKFHCLLNDIFHVQFPISREASRMSSSKKQKQLEALFMKILEQTVKEERLIFIIDDAQFVDSASWAFMENLIRTVPTFVIMSLSSFTDPPCVAANSIMRSRNTTCVTLGAIQPNDILNKICLDLNVSSICKELDSYLVEGSCGIPFYCEELLKNLDHHRVLTFQPVEYEEKANMNWNTLFKNFSKPRNELNMFASVSQEENEVVCNIASGVRLENLSPPASLKEISLVQLDSMSLSNQMLVRCAAITGQTFTTELLFEIIHCWDVKTMINALATLVESNIFVCFRNIKELRMALKQHPPSSLIHFRSLFLKSRTGMALSKKEELRELEGEVIHCHIIRFCNPIMQKTAYELWLKDQKKAMHLKCANFLEESAHKCVYCRSGDFIPYHRFTVDIQLNTSVIDTINNIAKARGIKKGKCPRPQRIRENTKSEEEIIFSRSEIRKKSDILPDNPSSQEVDYVLGFCDNIIKTKKRTEDDIIPLEPCQCEEILEIIVLPLAHHFLALGESKKALYYLLEATSAYLSLNDNYMAYVYLNEGEKLLKTLRKEKSWSQTFESATFFSLKGQICFNMGHTGLATKMLKKALNLLNRVFPDNFLSLFHHTRIEENRHLHYLNQQTQLKPPHRKKILAQLYQQTACFSMLWKIYSSNYLFSAKYYAHLAAIMQVNTAMETQDNFQIINAYLDYSLHHQLANNQDTGVKYEIMALEQVISLPLEGEDIEIMAHATETLSNIKLLMGHLDLAIDLGSRAHEMWVLLRNANKQYLVLCQLSKCLLLKCRYKELIQTLGWLWDLSLAEEHILSKAYFYFVCLDIMLYCGGPKCAEKNCISLDFQNSDHSEEDCQVLVYRTFEECLNFIFQNEDNRILKFQSGILLGLYSCGAIWYARLRQWDDFKIFYDKATSLVPRRTPTPLYCEGISRYLEGQVLYLQKQFEENSENAQDSGVQLLKKLECVGAQIITGPVFHPRLYHLIAYVFILLRDGKSCDLFLNTALELSETQGNLLEKCWLNMSKDWWYSGSESVGDQWLQTIWSLPSWEKIVSGKVDIQDIHKNKFRMKVNILDNPF